MTTAIMIASGALVHIAAIALCTNVVEDKTPHGGKLLAAIIFAVASPTIFYIAGTMQ